MLGLLSNLIIVLLTIGVLTAIVLDRLAPRSHLRSASADPTQPSSSGSESIRSSPHQPARLRAQALVTSLMERPVIPGLILGIGLVLLITGQVGLTKSVVERSAYLAWLAGLALIGGLYWEANRLSRFLPSYSLTFAQKVTSDRLRYGLWGLIAISTLALWQATPNRDADDPSTDLLIVWVLSILALIISATGMPSKQSLRNTFGWVQSHRLDLALLTIVAIASFIPRFYRLSSFPSRMSGDEGTFAITARSTLEGQLVNPFSSGPWGYPSLVFIVQGWFIDIFGGTVGSARMLSAALGMASVVASYALVRYHFGVLPAAATAALTTSYNFHLYWSRDAQDASAPMFFFPLALLLLDKGLIGRDRRYALSVGLVIAFAQFFHPANRLILLMAIAYIAYSAVLVCWDARPANIGWYSQLRKVASNSAWVTAGAIVGHLPLIAYFWSNPDLFWSRTDEVSVFASGWLEREELITGDGAVTIMAKQLVNAIMLPFSTLPHGHFRPDSPLVGTPMVAFVAIGLGAATIWCLHRRFFPIALGFWITTIGLAFTDGPPQTNRYTPAAPFLAILAVLGILVLVTIIIGLFQAPKMPVIIAAAVITVGLAGWHLNFTFRDDRQIAIYSDVNTELANVMARQIEPLGPDPVVYLAGSPRIYYYGFSNVPYIAPHATGIDVTSPWSLEMPPPSLGNPTVFGFVPERLNELEIVQTWFPSGTREDHMLPWGELLYTSYTIP